MLAPPAVCAAAMRCGAAARVTRRTLPTLREITSDQNLSSASRRVRRPMREPALLMRTSRPPRKATAWATRALLSSVVVRSALALAQRRPSCAASAASSRAPSALLR